MALAVESHQLTFDRPEYLATLDHLGRVVTNSGLPFSVIARRIDDTPFEDALGPWPYGSLPDAATLDNALDHLRAQGFVSLTATIPPGAETHLLNASQSGSVIAPLKMHLFHDNNKPRVERSRKTRRNIAIAERALTPVENVRAEAVAAVAAELHAELQTRRFVSRATRMPSDHFPRLLALPQCVTISAHDEEGIAGAMIGVRSGADTHVLHFLSARRGVPKCVGYLLMSYALDTWGRHGRVYFGGAPTGPDAAGITKFKTRWLNSEAPAYLLTAVLRDDVYRTLVSRCGGPGSGYFPAYRDAGIRPPAAVDA